MVTYQRIPAIRCFLIFHHDAMDLGYNVAGVRNRRISIDCKFSLETDGQRCKRRRGRTYVEDLKDPIEFSPPGRNLFSIDLRTDKARDWVALALLCDIPFDLCYGSAIGSIVCQPSKLYTVGSTHVVSLFIASRTDWLRWSIPLPFVPRSRT